MSVNDDLLDGFISHQVDLQRLDAGVRKKVLARLRQLKLDIETDLKNSEFGTAVRTTTRVKRQEALIAHLDELIKSSYKDSSVILDRELLEIADLTQDTTLDLIDSVFNKSALKSVGVSRSKLQAVVSDAMIQGAPSKDWWAQQSVKTRNAVASQIRIGSIAGETNDQIVQRIRGKATGQFIDIEIDGKKKRVREFSGGVLSTSTREAEALVRTSVQTIANDTHQQIYKENSDILRGQAAVVTFDLRTSPICQSRSGAAWDLDGNPLPESTVTYSFPGPPPWHWQCRTVLVPLTKSFEELLGIPGLDEDDFSPTERASMDGQIPDDQTYDEWLKKKPESVQRDKLGDAKYELWKKNKLSSTDLVDQTGRELTTDEIRQNVAGGRTSAKAKEDLAKKITAEEAKKAAEAAALKAAQEKAVREAAEKAAKAEAEKIVKESAAARKPSGRIFTEEALTDAKLSTIRNEYTRSKSVVQGTAKQTKALLEYTKQSGPINEFLRTGKIEGSFLKSYKDNMKAHAIELQDFVSKAPLTDKNLTLFRGIDHLGASDFKEGDVLSMDGFVSTSTAPIGYFTNSAQTVLEISVKRGSAGVLHAGNPVELEYILNHKSKFRVTEVKQTTLVMKQGEKRTIDHVKLELID